MKKLLNLIRYFFVGLSVIMLGYFGAYTVDYFCDTFQTIKEHHKQINTLISKNKTLSSELSNSKQSVYNLMGKVTVLKHKQANVEKRIENLNFEIKELVEYSTKSNQKIFKLSKNIEVLEPKAIILEKKVFNLVAENTKLLQRITELNAKKQEIELKPSYEGLKSSTVYIIKEHFLDSEVLGELNPTEASVGTGVIVKQRNNTSYILTNKHVCSEKNKKECFVEIFKYGSFVKIPLIFVKQAKSKYDLSLWKTDEILPNKKSIKGLKEAFPQDKVYSVGNYLGFKYIYTEGTFAGYEEDYSILNMSCVYGCSGSAVFNKDSYLIGLVFAGNKVSFFQVDTAKSLIVPYEIVKLFLEGVI